MSAHIDERKMDRVSSYGSWKLEIKRCDSRNRLGYTSKRLQEPILHREVQPDICHGGKPDIGRSGVSMS